MIGLDNETVAELRRFILAHRKSLPKITAKKAVLLETARSLGYKNNTPVVASKAKEELPMIVKRYQAPPHSELSKEEEAPGTVVRKKAYVDGKVVPKVVPKVVDIPKLNDTKAKSNTFAKLNELRRGNPSLSKKEIGELYSKGRLEALNV